MSQIWEIYKERPFYRALAASRYCILRNRTRLGKVEASFTLLSLLRDITFCEIGRDSANIFSISAYLNVVLQELFQWEMYDALIFAGIHEGSH